MTGLPPDAAQVPTGGFGADGQARAVPRRALVISIASLAIPVASAIWFPGLASNGLGTLTWLTALIPAFLLAYYRGLKGVAVALAGGMVVITATQIGIVVFKTSEPDWPLLAIIVGVYLVVSLGIGTLAELLRRERRVAESLALLDRLTGLPNRRFADMSLEHEFAAAARGGNLSVVLFDLDRFKSVNDRWGHAAGDEVLRAFARVLQAKTRRANISARFGGEEFISILRDTNAEAASLVAQRVLDETRELRFAWGGQTVSAGVAAFEHGMGSYELLVGAADRALYQAKESGRDMLCVAPSTSKPGEAPAARGPVPTRPRVESPTPSQAALRVPAGKLPIVYLVDDDLQVLSVLKRVLHGRGVDVWATADPADAIRKFTNATPADRPALIITDIIMPAMTGTRMMEQIAKIDPGVRVIYMSGYVHGEISWTGMPGSVVSILEKPITPDRLREVVRQALETPPEVVQQA